MLVMMITYSSSSSGSEVFNLSLERVVIGSGDSGSLGVVLGPNDVATPSSLCKRLLLYVEKLGIWGLVKGIIFAIFGAPFAYWLTSRRARTNKKHMVEAKEEIRRQIRSSVLEPPTDVQINNIVSDVLQKHDLDEDCFSKLLDFANREKKNYPLLKGKKYVAPSTAGGGSAGCVVPVMMMIAFILLLVAV